MLSLNMFSKMIEWCKNLKDSSPAILNEELKTIEIAYPNNTSIITTFSEVKPKLMKAYSKKENEGKSYITMGAIRELYERRCYV